MSDLAERYGVPNPSRRRWLVAGVTALAVVSLGWLAWAAIYQSTPQVRSAIVGFDVQGERQATATFEVRRSSSDVEASCLLRAISEDKSVVGQLTTPVTSGAETQRVTVTVRTERRATTVELMGCVAPGQPQRK